MAGRSSTVASHWEMAKLYHSISQPINPITPQLPKIVVQRWNTSFAISSASKAGVSSTSSKHELSQNQKKYSRKSTRTRRLITVSTSDARWHGEWSYEYLFSLRELQLADLAEDGYGDAEVLVNISVQKHAGFGFSIEGRIITSFNRKCSCCLLTYCREIDTTFDVWVLPSSRNNDLQLPKIGWNDPSVIYVKPGSEADLDSLVQDTLRLTASAKNTCSESCEKSPTTWQYTDGKKTTDQRWSKLLELKNAM